MTCFMPGCANRLSVTRSFREGPAFHACRAHEALLPTTRKDAEFRTQQLVLPLEAR
jgi:hypothetical protein